MSNKRKLLFVFLTIAILLSAAGIYYFKQQHQGSYEDNRSQSTAADTVRPLYRFTGNNGYLVKGKLIDNEAKAAYDQIPDTIFLLHFGDVLYCTTCPAVIEQIASKGATEVTTTGDAVADAQKAIEAAARQATSAASVVSSEGSYGNEYSPFAKKLSDVALNTGEASIYNKHLLAYIRLADEGKVSYPHFVSSQTEGSMVSSYDYQEKYGRLLGGDDATKKIPYLVKNKLLDFLDSDEGKGYTLLSNDKRSFDNLIIQAGFTGNHKEDVALILQPKNNYESNHKEQLLIFSFKTWNEVYILYNEIYYDKLLLETVPLASPKVDTAAASFYMDSEDPVIQATNDCLRIKIQDKPDMVLVYDPIFDKMKSYIQKPKSELENDNSNAGGE